MFEEWEGVDERVGALRAAEDAATRAFVAQADALLELWESSPVDMRSGSRPQALAEAALALGLHENAVGRRWSLAMGLREHPLLRTLLLDGRLGVPHALAVLDEADVLGDPDLVDRALDSVLLLDGHLGWDGTPGQLRTAFVRTAIRLDPAGAARRRAEQQTARSGVRLRGRDHGLADWTATGPATSLLAADRLLDALSARTGPDDERTRGQRQLDALLGALLHRAGSAVPLELELELPVKVTDSRHYPGVPVPEPVRVRADLTPELLHLLTADTGQDRPPTHDQGPAATPEVPPTQREPERAEPAGTRPVSTPGRPRVEDPQVERAEPAPPEPAAHRKWAEPPAPAERAGAPAHDQPLPRRQPAEPPQPNGRRRREPHTVQLLEHGPLDSALLRDLLDPAGLPVGLGPVTVRRVCADPCRVVVAVDDRPQHLLGLLAQGAGSPGALLRHLLDRLPQPPPPTTSHDPTAAQTRVLRARDPHCTWPGCRRPARRSDTDHRLRHPDGPTALANLHPLCRHHHRLKHDGFHPTRHEDGTTTWTTLRRQTITTRPRS